MMVWKQKLGARSWHILSKNAYAQVGGVVYSRISHHKILRFIAIGLAVLIAMPAVALAGGLTSSTNYELGEAFFGTGGELNACSSSYCSKQAIGELAVGDATSANYQAHAGFNTDRTPYIQIDVSNTNTNLGKLTPATTKTTFATFSVESYLAHGYTVIDASPPPTNGAYTMQTPSTPTTSNVGTEEFGINLVANTFPAAFGSNLVEEPDNTFSYGEVTPNYDTPNYYMYTQGDTIAQSTSSTSFTIYTISYIFNVSNVTPGGTYTFDDVLVATGTY